MAVGTELLLGQVIDTNSAWLGDRLALAGIDCLFQTKVGDNEARIASVIRAALARSDAVLVCGGLGPTPDDVTREGMAAALGAPLVRDAEMVERIKSIFESRQREMVASNARQADRPEGAHFVPQTRGTAPGLVCPAGQKVIYAVPGVPYEMQEMVERAVVPDLVRRAANPFVILSRMLRTWGLAESTLAERVAARIEALEPLGNPTIAFLATGVEGIKVRITAKAPSEAAARRVLDAEEAELRSILGDVVFGVDDQSMERVVADLLVDNDFSLGVAESLTGGLVGSQLAETEGASNWFRGSIVSYDSEVKFDLLDVPEGPVVSAQAAEAMARGAQKRLRADVGIAVTGVAGPATQDDQPVGTVFMAVAIRDDLHVAEAHFPGERQHVRQFSAISVLDLLRKELLERS
ncbi:MAG: competence/damage-inducible protein A [Actinomycetota bacterium]|nr:competence/damage-inducible protein A [Actinomycetota bacterium]